MYKCSFYNKKRICFKKSLKIPKGKSKSVYRRRTDKRVAKRKSSNNDPQNMTHRTTDQVTRTPLKIGSELRCPGRVSSSCSTSDTHRLNLVTKPSLFLWYFKRQRL